MKMLGFTGTRNTEAHEERLLEYIGSAHFHLFASHFDGFVTGGCRGWDALVGERLALKYPEKEHVVVIPWNKTQVDPWWEKFDLGTITLVYMPEGSDYRDRNTEIVRMSHHVFYCADWPEDDSKSTRSGTWMTKRIAEAAGVPFSGIIINKEEASE